MKKFMVSMILLLCIAGTLACQQGNDSGAAPEETSAAQEAAASEETSAAQEAAAPEETSAAQETAAPEETSAVQETVPAIKILEIDFAGSKVQTAEAETEAVPYTLSLVSEQDNNISGVLEWFSENELYLPMLGQEWNPYVEEKEDGPTWNPDAGYYNNVFYDEQYLYEWTPYELKVFDVQSGHQMYQISYQSDRWYLMGNCAAIRDGILYIAQLYNGYAMPGTCFLMAYDLENETVLWRSEDQTCNSMNFLILEDIIFCAYGFTAEKDYIYQLDRRTGKVVEKTEVKKMPDLLVEKEGQLYVHTYSYDYVFDLK